MDDQQTQNDSEHVLPTVQGDDQAKAEGAAVPGSGGVDDQTVPTSRALVATPEEAADSDLIEKEWVIKAKQIVEHTAEDPFQQQQELSKMKADYMKKRYNKDIGTS
jgi:Txe/YoeB family toxin of Txe-Axe toxin-antitoxin module